MVWYEVPNIIPITDNLLECFNLVLENISEGFTCEIENSVIKAHPVPMAHMVLNLAFILSLYNT